MKVCAIIPSRLGSTRLPGKPLKLILDLPMIEHVRRRTELSSMFSQVIVATCDKEIFQLVNEMGGIAKMTDPNHMRPTERTEEAAREIDCDIVLMVQGDEPLLHPNTLEKVVQPLIDNPQLLISNLVHPIKDLTEIHNPNVVKVALSESGHILFYSRSAIPSGFTDKNFSYHKQSGIMAFRKSFLHQYAKLKSTPLEINESIDMLRVLEHGFSIKAVVDPNETKGVDTPEHINLVESILNEDNEQMNLYKRILKKRG